MKPERTGNVLSGYFIYAKSQTISPTASHSYARSGTAFMFILCRAAKNEPRKRAKTFPLGTPLVARERRCAIASLMFARIVANSAFAFAF